MRTLTRRLSVAVLSVIVILVSFAWVAGGELSAPEPRSIGNPPPSLGAQDVVFASGSGSTIHGWLARGEPGRGAVLLLHGVRGDRRDMLSRAEFLHAHRYSVLLIDFQAHGESPGEQITFGARESRDVTAALVDGAAHVNLHTYAKDEYERRLLSFLEKNLNHHNDETAVTAP